MWTSERFQVSTLTWRKAGASLKSRSTSVRSASASSAASMTSGAASGMIAGGRFASAGCTGAGGTTAVGFPAIGGIAVRLGDRMRTLVGGRARMMPKCGMAAAASPSW